MHPNSCMLLRSLYLSPVRCFTLFLPLRNLLRCSGFCRRLTSDEILGCFVRTPKKKKRKKERFTERQISETEACEKEKKYSPKKEKKRNSANYLLLEEPDLNIPSSPLSEHHPTCLIG